MKQAKEQIGSVFYISLAIVILFVLSGILVPETFEATANALFKFIVRKFGWLYLMTVTLFLIFCIFIATSKFGKIKLGDDDSKPAYSYMSWFAMLFSAGMGIGLVFWGVAEPIFHFLQPPVGTGGTEEAAKTAMTYAFFHWGLHPWATYSIIALSLAYFQFRKKLPALISSTFYPLIGDRIYGPIGKAIDILAIFATVSGVATSMGLGTLQINGGLNYLFGVPLNITVQVVIILVTTVLFMISATTGLDKGIKILSNLNLLTALFLMILALIIGPTAKILNMMSSGIGNYLNNIINLSLNTRTYTNPVWMGNWTLFYWAWWIAWAPFVGTFIARISKGRTIREFISGVLLVPTLGAFIWFSTFGTAAIDLALSGNPEILEKASGNVSTAFFEIFSHYPLGSFISIIAVLLVFTFFVTSADSATFVLGMLSSNGDLRPKNSVKLAWGIVQSSLALVLLFTGGLEALQTASISAAFPFAIILTLMMVSLYRALHQEKKGKKVK